MLDLKGKSAIITGAGNGMGRAIALLFAKQGCNLGINDIKKESVLETIKLIENYPIKAVPLVGDVSNHDKVNCLVDEFIQVCSKIDILVNNAGYGEEIPFEKITIDQWNKMLAVHLTGCFNWTKAVVPMMKEQKQGKIINMSSIFGLVGAQNWSHYSAAKAGIAGLTKSLAKELAPYRINVNAIAPGTIATSLHWWMTEEDHRKRGEIVPLGRQGKAEEIAFLALYLASKESDFITGQVISPNGGEVIVGI